MQRLNKIQLIAIGGAIVLAFSIYFLPKLPAESTTASGNALSEKVASAAWQVSNGQNPMQGIKMLREVLEEDPNNLDALWHLARFSIQTGQFEKAVQRLEKISSIDHSPDVFFYLGQSYAELGKYEEALTHLEHFMELSSDKEVVDAVSKQIESIKQKQNQEDA